MAEPTPTTATSASRSEKLGVVVPLANEEDVVEEFLRRVLAHLAPQDSVFCVLDNVSRDSTRGKIEAFAERDPRVVLVWAPENRCVVDAYFRGYRAALAAGCDWILEMDGGMSHLPEEIPLFLAAMAQGAEFAAGSRFIEGGSHTGRLSRRWLSKGGTVLANLVLGTRMRDMTSGFECFAREALEQVVAKGVRSKAHFFQTAIRFMLRHRRWVEIPITYSAPSSTVGKDKVLEALRNLWQLRREARAERRRGSPA